MAKKNSKAPAGNDPARRRRETPSAAQLASLDRQIVELINRRAALAQQRCEARGAPPPESTDAIVLETAAKTSEGPLPPRAVAAVFRELLSGIRAACEPIRVAYLGPEFTYSHLAAIARFGQSAELVAVGTIAAVFEEVERGHAAFGVVPIENSTDGRVADALECFGKLGVPIASAPPASSLPSPASLQICAEVPLRIRHCLLGHGPRSAVGRVCSKPQALSQCRNWLSAHLPAAKLEPTASTGEAASLAIAEPDTAAIASEQAAAHYGLHVLARHIEDNADNVTRFAIIGRTAAPRTGQDKTALVFEAPHKPGALADAMAIFKRQRLNLTWIESFPIPGARGRYLFFIEFQGHPAELRAKRAIAALTKKSLRLVILGSYAEAEVVCDA
jgi:chorismate mutase/prephenate dehydratase